MGLNAKTHVDVEQVIFETSEPVTVGAFLLKELLRAERALCEPAQVSDGAMRQIIRSWGMASYAGLTVTAGSADMIIMNLVGHSCRHYPSFSFSGMTSVEVPVDLFVLASRIIAVKNGDSDDDECGLRMAFNRGMSAWVLKNAPDGLAAPHRKKPVEMGWPPVGIMACREVMVDHPATIGGAFSSGLGSGLGMRVPGGMS